MYKLHSTYSETTTNSMLKMAGNEILTFDKQPSLGLLTSALQVYLCPIWIDAETAEERIFSLKEFQTLFFGLSFITFRCEPETDYFILSSHLPPATLPPGPASSMPTTEGSSMRQSDLSPTPQPSQFLTLSSVSTLYSVAHFGVLIYTNQYVKDICWHLFVKHETNNWALHSLLLC